MAHTVWVRLGTDSMILIEYYSELLNHVSAILNVLARLKYTDNLAFFYLNYSRHIFAVPGLPIFLTRDFETLNITLSISHNPWTHTVWAILYGISYGPYRMAYRMAYRSL